jgi:hypothetical protein
MNDDQEQPLAAGPGPDAQSYLYDFFKYMTSLSLLTLAAILAVSQLPEAADLAKTKVVIALGIVSLGALTAFAGAGQVVRSKMQQEPLAKQTILCLKAAPAVYLIGVGYFLMMFLDVMY